MDIDVKVCSVGEIVVLGGEGVQWIQIVKHAEGNVSYQIGR